MRRSGLTALFILVAAFALLGSTAAKAPAAPATEALRKMTEEAEEAKELADMRKAGLLSARGAAGSTLTSLWSTSNFEVSGFEVQRSCSARGAAGSG